MKKICKKIVSSILALGIAGSMGITVFAEKQEKSLLVMGDSITSGYRLENYVDGDNYSATDSFANKLGKGYTEYTNLAVDGRTTDELYTSLKTEANEYIKNADVIVISIGGNDFLQPLLSVLTDIIQSDPSALIDYIGGKDPIEIISSLYEKYGSKIEGVMNSVEYDSMETDIKYILKYIREQNPLAEIYILTVYNPFSGVEGSDDLSNLTEKSLTKLNSYITKYAEKYDVNVIDVKKSFNKKAEKYTNISELDIHPNKDGHKLIYSKLYKAIKEENEKNADRDEMLNKAYTLLSFVSSLEIGNTNANANEAV